MTVRSHPLYGIVSIVIAFGLLWILSHRMRRAQIRSSVKDWREQDEE